jgi:hypothetical protein
MNKNYINLKNNQLPQWNITTLKYSTTGEVLTIGTTSQTELNENWVKSVMEKIALFKNGSRPSKIQGLHLLKYPVQMGEN